MINEAYFDRAEEINGRMAKFIIIAYKTPIRPGTILRSKNGAAVYVRCIIFREFYPEDRAKKTVEQLAKYIFSETDPGHSHVLEVEGDVNDFNKNSIIYIEPKTG